MSRLSIQQRVQVINALGERNTIRATCPMTGVGSNTAGRITPAPAWGGQGEGSGLVVGRFEADMARRSETEEIDHTMKCLITSTFARILPSSILINCRLCR